MSGTPSGGYDPKSVEPAIYQQWLDGGYFHAAPDADRIPFTIVIPPPNVTGALHLGHATNNTLQDILIRRKRMQGFNACWLPGTDHAGIATQAVVERRLREEQNWIRDNTNPEHREFLVKKIWEWKEEYGARIITQLKKMGCSCDWERERFTLDEGCVRAVYETFFRFFRDGLIYRGTRLVNWDTQLQTAVADDEVYHETVRGSLWHVRYPMEGTGNREQGAEFLVVATTRPETMLADTAVAVHPEDERYKHLIGKRVVLPLTGRTIPVIADDVLVKREFGTGCVKVTPGHDPNDYACYQRKQGKPDEIAIRTMMTPDGKVHADNSGEGNRYAGLKLDEARKRIVADLESAGLLEKVEPYETEVGHSDRSKTPIQPYLSEQWFLKMGHDKLAEPALEAVRDGRVRFFPERFAKSYLDWLGEKRDWCISRQLWWGHRIPVWSKRMAADCPPEHDPSGFTIGLRSDDQPIAVRVVADDGTSYQLTCGGNRDYAQHQALRARGGEVVTWQVCLRAPEREMSSTAAPGAPVESHLLSTELERWGFRRDPDVLDTWFSSMLWPMSTFGWPGATNGEQSAGSGDLDYFYPTTVLSTAREIISLWVVRMVMCGLYNLRRMPFQHVLIHPTIQDGQGRRMSKSAGNGVDPLDLIELYGADAMRVTLASLAGESQDVRIPVKPTKLPDGRVVNSSEKFEWGRNFVNKLWQAATGFVIPTCRDVQIKPRGMGNAELAMQSGGVLHTSRLPAEMPTFERWIRVKLLGCIRQVDRRIDRYEFSAAVDALRAFFWDDLCDWYIEEVKTHLRGAASDDEKNDVKITLLQVFDITLSLLHPAIPFVTEAVWREIGAAIPRHHELIWPEGKSPPTQPPALIVSPWPSADENDAWIADVAAQRDAEREVDDSIAVIRALREIRTHINAIRAAEKQPALRTLPHAAIRCHAETADRLNKEAAAIHRLGSVEGLAISPDVPRPAEAVSKILSGGIQVFVQITGLCDIEIERKRLHKEREEVGGHLARLEAKLGNEGFVAKAPPAVIEQERARQSELRAKLRAIEENLAEVGG